MRSRLRSINIRGVLLRAVVLMFVPAIVIGVFPEGAYPFAPLSRFSQNSVYYFYEVGSGSIPLAWRPYVNSAASKWNRSKPGGGDSWMDLLEGPISSYGALDTAEVDNLFNCAGAIACTGMLPFSTKFTRFDDDPSWTAGGITNCGANIYSVETIALHEFGHWVELADHPSGHNESVMHFDCTDKWSLRQDDRDGLQYQYGAEYFWGSGYGSGGLVSQLSVPGGQPNWLRVNGTANSQYWNARGQGQVVYRLGPITNAGSNTQWRLDIDVNLSSASGTGWTPQLYLIDTSGHWVKVGWMKDTVYPNTTWFVQSSAGDVYWGNGSSVGNDHHFAFVYNPSTKYLSWVVDVTPMWSSYSIQFDNPYVVQQGIVRAIGDSIDVTFKNFRIRTE